MARHPVATLCSQSAGWVLPVVGIGLFLHKHFIADVGSTNPADARFKAVARCRNAPKGQRRVRRRPSPITEADNQTDTLEQQLQQQERELTDAVLGNDTVYEWFNEDEVEALQQAQAQSNPQALLDLLHHYGSRMAAEGFIHDEDDQDSDGSLWYTDEPEQSWQQDSPSISPQKQQQPDSAQGQRQQQQQDAGQQFLRQLAAAQPQQQQDGAQQGADRAASPAGSDAHAEGDYFDDSYFGLPADESAAPRDLQELQAAVSKNLEALLPKDSTWTGSYPPRFDEVLSPADAGGYIDPGSEGGYITGGDGGGYIGPAPEFDFDLDPGFDYVPDFDYDPDFDPDFDDDMLDMFDFDIEP